MTNFTWRATYVPESFPIYKRVFQPEQLSALIYAYSCFSNSNINEFMKRKILTLSSGLSTITDSGTEPRDIPLSRELLLAKAVLHSMCELWMVVAACRSLLLLGSLPRGILSLFSSLVKSLMRSLITFTSLVFSSGCSGSFSSSCKKLLLSN